MWYKIYLCKPKQCMPRNGAPILEARRANPRGELASDIGPFGVWVGYEGQSFVEGKPKGGDAVVEAVAAHGEAGFSASA